MSTSRAAKYVTISKRFGSTSYENICFRCGQTVYQVDKVGPLKDFSFFHRSCLKCRVCGSKLTLKTYFNNQQDNEDREVSDRLTSSSDAAACQVYQLLLSREQRTVSQQVA